MKKALLITSLLVSGFLLTGQQSVKAATPVEKNFTSQMVKSFAGKLNTIFAKITVVEPAQDVIEPVVYEEEVVVDTNPCPYGHENCDGNHMECAQGHLDCTFDHTSCAQGHIDCTIDHSNCPQGHENCDGTHQGQHNGNGNGNGYRSGNGNGAGNGHHQGNGNCYRQ